MPTVSGTGGAQTPAPSNNPEDQQQKIVDHFEGIDLDELPDNVRGAVQKARESITTLSTSASTSERQRAQAEIFARQQQSKADKLAAVVSKHNLDPDASSKPNLAGDKHAERVARIMGTVPGISKELAETQARMLGAEADELRKEILSQVGAVAQNVNHVNAAQVLSAKEIEKAEFFAIPEVGKLVRDNVAVLVGQGQEVSSQAVDHLISLAVGQHLINGGKMPEKQTEQIPNFTSNNLRGGGHVRLPSNSNDRTPPTSDPQTTSIMSAINVHMRQGIPEKKK